jgi:hypothetical protein
LGRIDQVIEPNHVAATERIDAQRRKLGSLRYV